MARRNIRVFWENPPSGAVYLEWDTARGPKEERRGPRSLLTLEETAAVLNRSVDEVQRAIEAGFLRSQSRDGDVFVTPRACRDFLAEEAEDRAITRARRREPTTRLQARTRSR